MINDVLIGIGLHTPIYALDYDPVTDTVAVAVGSEVQVAAKLSTSTAFLDSYDTHLTGTLGTYATSAVIPEPPSTQLAPESADMRLRPRSVHFVGKGSQLIVAYLNHGIMQVAPIWEH